MIEARGNLWAFEIDVEVGAGAGQSCRLLRCITTNGVTHKDEATVMSRGAPGRRSRR